MQPTLRSAVLALVLFTPAIAFQEAGGSSVTLPTAPDAGTWSPEVNRLIELGREGKSHEILVTLVTRFPGRVTGSKLLQASQDWAVEYFKDLGLEARLERWGAAPVGFDRGASRGRMLSPEGRTLTFITPVWTPGTAGAQVGRAILEPAKFDELEALRDELSGAWMVRNSKVSRRERAKYEKLYIEVGVAGTVRSGEADGRLVMGGQMRIDPDDLPKLVKVTLFHEEFKELVRDLTLAGLPADDPDHGEPVRLEFDIENHFTPEPVPQYNVVADLVGSEFPDEYVIVGGHIDGWDAAQAVCDNGTGVATAMEAARLLVEAGITPRRTIRFVLYGGEEQGLLGSRGYVKKHADELESISVVLNHDTGTHYLRGIRPTAGMVEDFKEVFAPVMTLDPARPFEVRKSDALRGGGSDHASFISAGVPAFHVSQSTDGYRRLHHTQFDTLDEVIPEDQQHSSMVIALGAYGFAQLDHLIDRTLMVKPEPRRMGVYLGGDEGCSVDRVLPDSKASAAGWKVGDVVLSIDGVAIEGRDHLIAQLQQGGPTKAIRLKRGEEELESVFDYSDEPEEKAREAWNEANQKRARK